MTVRVDTIDRSIEQQSPSGRHHVSMCLKGHTAASVRDHRNNGVAAELLEPGLMLIELCNEYASIV